MSKPKTSSTPPAAPSPADQRDAAIAALQQDQGPAVLTVAVNIVTGRTSISGVMRSEVEMRAILSALSQAQAHVTGLLEKAAEASGRAGAQPQPSKE